MTAVVEANVPDPDAATEFLIVTVKEPVVLFSTQKKPTHAVVMVMLALRTPDRYRMTERDSAAVNEKVAAPPVRPVRSFAVLPPKLSSR